MKKEKLPVRFERITAKQVRNRKIRGDSLPSPKKQREEALKDHSEIHSALGGWRVGFLDIETTGLGADFGHILCACIKPSVKSSILTLRLDDYKGYHKDLCNDLLLVKDIRAAMDEYDVLVTWNGDNFDLPFIDTRLVVHGEKRAPLVHSIDLLPICRKKLRLNSNRLDSVAVALGLVHEKTKLQPQIWQRASHGSKVDLDYIVDHCKADVLVLEETFNRFRGFIDAVFRRR